MRSHFEFFRRKTPLRMMTKLGDYEQMGIQTILVLDPDGKHFRWAGAPRPLAEIVFPIFPGASADSTWLEIVKLLDS